MSTLLHEHVQLRVIVLSIFDIDTDQKKMLIFSAFKTVNCSVLDIFPSTRLVSFQHKMHLNGCTIIFMILSDLKPFFGRSLD